MSERVTRSRSVVNPEMDRENEVIAGEQMANVNLTAIQGKSRGRPKGKAVQKTATQIGVSNVGTRGGKTSRGIRQNESIEIRDEQEESHQERSASVRGRKQTGNRGRGRTEGFVTQENFAAEMGKLQETLNALLAQRNNEVSVSKEKSEDKVAIEVAESPVTAMGSHTQSGPMVSVKAVTRRGCSFKEFAACKPLRIKGNVIP
ncbi:hypothetical protein L6452_13652 [Arctium lappa]|uniref:Uncharacterized protein n=1 Tax=Arctium lappa TaxID=4217 RepID=A0ACB9CIV9_ARCLA|nr:hypothetical protein L6452_13652 [Arctium lappa]